MARRPKTPGTPAQRDRNTSGQGAAAAAPAKPKARHSRSPAVEQPDLQSVSMSAGPVARPQGQEEPSDFIEQRPAAEARAGRESRASRASEAVKALGEMLAAGMDALEDLRTEVREVSRRLDQLAAAMPGAGQAAAERPQPAATASDADEYPFGRDRDPGDAVPPGVATMTPSPLTETDEAVLHTLEDLPKRTGRGRRGPRAKA